ncbi:MAG: hypothetical protein WC796_04700 [Candidatus Pacearchaeota archaeon]|jgi:hypothetical protein
MGTGNKSFQVAIEYSGNLVDYGALLKAMPGVEDECRKNIPEFHTMGSSVVFAGDYDPKTHAVYCLATREEADAFQRAVVDKGLATVVHVDEF